MDVKQLPREFVFDNKGTKITLADPNPALSVDQVRKHYSALYPELTSAEVGQPEVLKSKVKYTFSFNNPRTKG
jgi:PRTRC genetic system protein C